MLFLAVFNRIEWNLSVYFYFFTILLLGELISCEKDTEGSASIGAMTSPNKIWHQRRTCFNMADPALEEAKQFFQDLTPYRSKHFEPISDEAIRGFLLYFSSVTKVVERLDMTKGEYRLSIAWYDTIGDYLRGYLIPISQYCFYAGNVSYQSVHSVSDYYRTIKMVLDTSGQGWSRSNITIMNVEQSVDAFGTTKARFNCSELAFNTSTDIPLPKVELDDDDQVIISLWVPLKSRQFYDPRSKRSLSVLRIYYQTVDRCIPHTAKSRRNFVSTFMKWIDQNLTNHLMDEQFYPGLESILRIKKTLEATIAGKVLTKKSVEENDNESNDESRGFFGDLFAPIVSSSADEDYEDNEDRLKQDRLYYIKIGIASIGLGLLLLIVIVAVVKLIKNRKMMKRKSKHTRLRSSDRRRFSGHQNGAASDEEVLLALDKKPSKTNASETSDSRWRYVKPSISQKFLRKKDPPSRQLMPAFSDSEDNSDPIPFQPKKQSVERTPLIGGRESNNRRKKRCGRGCLCMNCIRVPKTSAESQDIQSSSQYRLVDETGAGNDVEQIKNIAPTREESSRRSCTVHKKDLSKSRE
ncbi:uncharacterized protein LOC129733196 [Wyeomyia smithii]|uniref:uncharacterized protein LOC129733196 n=1 Tax=Wyeomyia smithii TaxID=174621 RepID=UPI002467CC19|nr:uncharacterized protein LOC129733196 [Wyeomyia smithii]